MDFSKLAITEVRRNPTRTIVAILACALSAMIVILLRVVPEGYSVGLAMPERTFSGGDIVIFPAQAPLTSSEEGMLTWRNWPGSDWQSHLLYYFPETDVQGYLAEESCTGWRGMIPENVIEKIKGIPNVGHLSVYRSLPCVVTVEGQQIAAILRGFDMAGHPIDGHLSLGLEKKTAFSSDDAWEILVPDKQKNFSKLQVDDLVSILIPKPTFMWYASMSAESEPALQIGLDWDAAEEFQFAISQKYAIQVGVEFDMEAAVGSPDPPPPIPVYWERPEFILPMKTFQAILEKLSPKLDYGSNFDSLYPSYQMGVVVDKSSKLRETTRLIREALGNDYGVYAVPEAVSFTGTGNHVVMPPDLHRVYSVLIIGFASVVVAGNIYIIVVQQKRKLGLLRAVGATSSNIIQYILTLVAYVSALGSLSGIIVGNILYLVALLGTDLSIKEWFLQTLGDSFAIIGLSAGLSLAIGFGIAWWASRLSCSEVLSRE